MPKEKEWPPKAALTTDRPARRRRRASSGADTATTATMADEQQMTTTEAAADVAAEPAWHTAETAQTETVTGLGQAAFSIVVRTDSLDDDEPAIGVALPAVPPRKSALHVFGESQAFPNVYGTTQTTRTDAKSVGTGRRFTIIVGKALMPGATVSTRPGSFACSECCPTRRGSRW